MNALRLERPVLRGSRLSTTAALLFSLAVSSFGMMPSSLDAADADSLQVKQRAQQRAREMAHELVSRILDLQLRQLEENGLSHLQLFRDIGSMRKNIKGLVEAEMLEVVEILAQAQTQDDPDLRFQAVQKARGMIREIVARLAF